MNMYETNIFPILNLEKLKSKYRLFEITGINTELDEYDSNIQHIINRLSYLLQHPVTVVNHNDRPHVVIKDDASIAERMPDEFQLTRNPKVYFKEIPKTLYLDYLNYSDETREICKRFLGFDLQTELFRHPKLWQPGSGKPYFQYYSDIKGNVAICKGFSLRIVELPVYGFGVCINPTKKFLSAPSIKTKISRDEFKRLRLRGKHVIYKHPKNWYEFKIEELSDLNVSTFKYERGDSTVSLIEDLRAQGSRPYDRVLATLPDDASVVIYKDNKGFHRGAPAALCHLILDSESNNMGKFHQQSIMQPFQRWKATSICRDYLQKIEFGNIKLEISETPFECERKLFIAPDLEFGNDTVLSVRNSNGSKKTAISSLGKERKYLLEDEQAGFFVQRSFDRQFFVMPKSIFDSMGVQFMDNLRQRVDKLYPSGGGYDPKIITYEDRNARTYVEIGMEIVKAVSEQNAINTTSYGVVMIPDYERAKRKHDELAALVVRKLLELDIHVGVMHTNTIEKCYEFISNGGDPFYRIKREFSSKLTGYIYNIALNKVLLTNLRWPFVLATPLHADLTIGIDVKHHTAGFTFVDKYGKNIRPDYKISKRKEKLSRTQLHRYFRKQLADEAAFHKYQIRKIVIHRDGRLFSCEREGILDAVKELSQESILPTDVSVTFVEIPKKSAIPFKLYEKIEKGNSKVDVYNPQIGSYTYLNEREAFLCTTGREFFHPGTSNPLYVKYHSGTMAFDEVLEDIYFLSALAYSRPEDCTRYPLTIKITDRKLSEVASEFDEEELNELLEENNIDRP